MAGFYVYETYPLAIRLKKEGVLTDYQEVVVSISQGNKTLNLTEDRVGVDVDNDTININLSQEETAKFTPKREAKIQVNVYYTDQERDVSAQGTLEVMDNLYKELME